MVVDPPMSGSTLQNADVVRVNDLYVSPEYQGLLEAVNLESLDALFAVQGGDILDKPGLQDWRKRVRLRVEYEDKAHVLYLKRFEDPPATARRHVRWARQGAASVAGLEWAWLCALRKRGIACPAPIAFGEEFRGRREVRSALLMAAVPGDALERLLPHWGVNDRATVKALVPAVARLIARLHGCGFVHRDLYLSHVFFDETAEIERSLHLIDVQRVLRPACCAGRWIVKDLAALHYSTPDGIVTGTDRLRWLKCYLGLPKLDAAARRLVYRIVGKTARMRRHDLVTDRLDAGDRAPT